MYLSKAHNGHEGGISWILGLGHCPSRGQESVLTDRLLGLSSWLDSTNKNGRPVAKRIGQ